MSNTNLRNLYLASEQLVARRVPEYNDMEFRHDGNFYYKNEDIDRADSSSEGPNRSKFRNVIKTVAGSRGVGDTTLRRAMLVKAFVNAENQLVRNEDETEAGLRSSMAGTQEVVDNHSEGRASTPDMLLDAVSARASDGGYKDLFYQDKHSLGNACCV